MTESAEPREFFLTDLIYQFAIFAMKQRPDLILSAKGRPWHILTYETKKRLGSRFPELERMFEFFDWDSYPKNQDLVSMLHWMKSIGYFQHFPDQFSNTMLPCPNKSFGEVPEELLQEMLAIALSETRTEDTLLIPRS